MKEFLITPLEMLTDSPSEIKPSSVIIYSYLFYLCSKNIDRKTDIKNRDLKNILQMDLNTIKRTIGILKKSKYIEISGSTRNRRIYCNDPYEISQQIKENKFKKEHISNLEVEKWYIEYMEDIPKPQRIEDIKSYSDDYYKLPLSIRTKFEKTADPKDILNIDLSELKRFIHIQLNLLQKMDNIKKRAGEYDIQHKGFFQKDIQKYYIDNNIVEIIKYTKLAECPYELQKNFLLWIEPELF